jgi:3-(3-hydroxy-phenyl)propionate hydroxylase
MTEPLRTSVTIVGGGPVGITIANLLGTYGIDTVVLERSLEILPYPRAVGMDDESLRVLQTTGLADAIARDSISNVPMRMFTAAGKCFADIRPATREFGWYRRNIFSQPIAEVTLRAGLERFSQVQLLCGAELTALEQDEQGATLRFRDIDGHQRIIATRFVVGADGGRSTVRELLGVPFDGTTHPRKWVVIECEDDPLDAPFTALHCDPKRPYVSLRLPYGLRRWEFILFPGEDDATMLQPPKICELLADHVADPAALRIVRARVYTHHSRVARAFHSGHVFLAGDAAHLSPPWIGQGLNAGLRDAGNLAWKLAAVVNGRLGPNVLETYHHERHEHAQAMIDVADRVGTVFALRNRLAAWLRDRLLLGMHRIPPVRDYVVQMRFKPMPVYGERGFVQAVPGAANARVGRMIPQPLVQLDGDVLRFDDTCGPWFAIVGWQTDPRTHLSAPLLAQWRAAGARFITVVRARDARMPPSDGDCTVVQDTENVLSYWFEDVGAQIAIVRPDRYVAALCRADALGGIGEALLALAPAERTAMPA